MGMLGDIMIIKKVTTLVISTIAALIIVFAPGFDEQKAEASTSVSASSLTEIASKYKGVRYKSGGTTEAGFDCSGYVQFVYKQLGVSLTRSTGSMYDEGSAIEKANIQVGDLLFFKTTSAKVGHVGIYIGNGKFIHSSTSKGVMVSNVNDPYYWGDRYVGAKRVASVVTEVAAK